MWNCVIEKEELSKSWSMPESKKPGKFFKDML
jgi:hypothetical protein